MITFNFLQRIIAIFGIAMVFAVSGWGDTYNDYSVSLTTGGYTNSSLIVKSNAIDRFTITLQSAGTFSVSISGNSTVKFNISTSSMPDNSTHTLTSAGPTIYPSGQVLYLSSSAPTENSNQTYTITMTLVSTVTSPTISIGDSTFSPEGNTATTAMSFPITLSTPLTSATIVSYLFENIDTNSSDTNMTSGSTYTFTLPINSLGTIQVPLVGVVGDTVIENNKTFRITLSSATNGVTINAASSVGIGTIIDDDTGGGGVTPPVSLAYANVDVVNSYSGSGAGYDSWITTKVSAKPNMTLTAVYLGIDPANPVPQPYTPSGNAQQAASIILLFKLADMSGGATCQNAPTVNLNTTLGGNTPVVAFINPGNPGDTTAISNAFVMGYAATGSATPLAKKDVRIKYKAVDFNALIDASSVNCANKSSTGGNVEGIPQCLITNSPDHAQPGRDYETIFGTYAFNNCYHANGEPCKSNNHGIGTPPYDTPYGCFECSIGAMPYTCSKDNFAIRPDHFDINTADPDSPNLLRAGEDYNHTVYAYDYGITSGTIGSLDYNQTAGVGGNIDLNQSRFMATGVADDGTLHGNLVWSAWDFNMTNGISNQNGDLTQTEVAGVQYDDVGKINLRAEDKEWASVDINNPNDPTPHNCSPDGAYLCSDKNVTYIPHHFGFEELNITNHAGPDSNFTYIADNRGMPSATPPTRSPMAARVQTQIRALTKNNTITQNFRADDANHPYDDSTLYYENDVRINLAVTIPATGTNSYLYPDANESSTTNAANPNTYNYIGFGRSGLDANGTRNIYWNESNFPLEFNFQRKINEPANPFDVNGSYLSISIHSIYTDASTPSSPADINGSRIGDQNGSTTCATDEGCVELNADSNATFYYARTRPSKFFYDDITSSSAVTPIFIDVYCDLGFTACDAFDIDTVNGQINDADWWLSWEHSKSQGDGNITLSASANGSVSAPPKPNIDASGGADKTVTVTHGSITLPDIVDIDFNPATDAWLIHNPDNPWTPSPFYRVRFIGQSGWTGVGKTGNVLDTGISTKKSKRLDW